MTKKQRLLCEAIMYMSLYCKNVRKDSFKVYSRMLEMHFYETISPSVYSTKIAKREFFNNGRNFLYKRGNQVIELLTDEECEDAVRCLHSFIKSH